MSNCAGIEQIPSAQRPKSKCPACEYQVKKSTLSMRPLKCLVPAQHAYVKSEGGYYELNEFSRDVNKYSRAKIRAMKRERGEAWLGVINPSEGCSSEIKQYRSGMVFNFGASFVIPRFDQELLDLMQKRLTAPYTGASDDYQRVTKIFDRVHALGGISLIWE